MSQFTSSARIVRVDQHWQATTALICGDVSVGNDCSFWFHSTVRGDVAPITIGARTNIQEHACLHCDTDKPLHIGEEVTIGHSAVVHGVRVGHRSLIGMKAVLLGDSVVGENCIVGAGAVLSPGTIVPDGQVVMGIPAKIVRPVRPAEILSMRENMLHYIELARQHTEEPQRAFTADRDGVSDAPVGNR